MMRRFLIIALAAGLSLSVVLSGKDIDTFEREIKAIQQRVAPSIVKVIAESQKRYVATGIVLTPDTVLSSTMIIRRPFRRLYVKTIDGQILKATVSGRDPGHSLVVLKVDGARLRPAKRASSPRIGDWVALLGVFYDKFPSIVQGIVSSISEDELILNAPVFPGASGGAVVNRHGDLVAVIRGRVRVSLEPDISIINDRAEMVVRGRSSNNATMCYATPIEKVVEISRELRKYGRIRRGWLGVNVSSDSLDKPAVITSVAADSPAAEGGLKVGDIIVKIDESEIQGIAEIGRVVRNRQPGDTITITVNRGNRTLKTNVVVGELTTGDLRQARQLEVSIPSIPDMADLANRFPRRQNLVFFWHGSERLGFDVIDLTRDLARKFSVKEGDGLMISRIYPQSPAEKAGLQPGDILVNISQQTLRSMQDLQRVLVNLDNQPGSLSIRFYRDGSLQKTSLKPQNVKDPRSSIRFIRENLNPIKDNLSGFITARTASILYSELARIQKLLDQLEGNTRSPGADRLREIEHNVEWLVNQARATFESELQKSRRFQEGLARELERLQEQERRIQSRLKRLKIRRE